VQVQADRAAPSPMHAGRLPTPADVVLIAGKGHEDYQEMAAASSPFSDLAHARAALAARQEPAHDDACSKPWPGCPAPAWWATAPPP
jgi:hypothetical protein